MKNSAQVCQDLHLVNVGPKVSTEILNTAHGTSPAWWQVISGHGNLKWQLIS